MEQGTLFEQLPIEAPAPKKHAGGRYWLFNSLMNGCYIMERGGKSKTFQHCLYELNSMPVRKIASWDWKKVKDLVRLKKNRSGSKYYINLSSVRKLHGNSAFKKLYKQRLKNK